MVDEDAACVYGRVYVFCYDFHGYYEDGVFFCFTPLSKGGAGPSGQKVCWP